MSIPFKLYIISLTICVLMVFYGHTAVAQYGNETGTFETSYKDSFSTNVNQGSYFQLGLNLSNGIPNDSYNELTESRGGSPDIRSVYSASFDHFWNFIGIGIETGFFSNEYEKAPYTTIVSQYDVAWEKDDWSNLYFGIGPTFSLNNGLMQYQIAFKTGIMRTKSPAYKSIFTVSHPDLLWVEYPSSTLRLIYGSVTMKANYIASKNFSVFMSFSYLSSIDEEYNYRQRELKDYDGDGGYSLDDIENSPIRDQSLEVKPEIFTIGLGINYRFQLN